MYNVIKQKKFKVESFTEALKNTLECAEDMVIDVPRIATYLAQIIAPIFAKDVSIEFLSEACEPIKDKPICADFISEVLVSASRRLGHSKVAEIFEASNLSINDFLRGVDNSAEFLRNKVSEGLFLLHNNLRPSILTIQTHKIFLFCSKADDFFHPCKLIVNLLLGAKFFFNFECKN